MLTETQIINLPVKSTKMAIRKSSHYIKREKSNTELSQMIIDPNNSTPPNHFMNGLKTRMNIYYASDDK